MAQALHALSILILIAIFFAILLGWIALVWAWICHNPWIERHLIKLASLLGFLFILAVSPFFLKLPDWLNAVIAPLHFWCLWLLLTFYFAPSLIAARRQCSGRWMIFWINLLGGFPIGWGIALKFALSEEWPRG